MNNTVKPSPCAHLREHQNASPAQKARPLELPIQKLNFEKKNIELTKTSYGNDTKIGTEYCRIRPHFTPWIKTRTHMSANHSIFYKTLKNREKIKVSRIFWHIALIWVSFFNGGVRCGKIWSIFSRLPLSKYAICIFFNFSIKLLKKNWDLAQIETDEAETWHTLTLLVYLGLGQVSASYLSIYSSKFQMNLAAQITAVCRHSRAQSYHCRKNFYSKK